MNGVISGDTLIGIITTDETLTGVLTNPKNIDLSDDTITPEDLRNGIKAHDSSGAQITGSMVDNGAVIETINTKNEEYTINEGYHNGNGKVSIDSSEQEKIISENIKKDINILGVIGTLEAANLNWGTIGYSEEPKTLQEDYNYAVEIMNNWIPVTSLMSKFENDTKLVYMPLVDTSLTTTMQNTFRNCSKLQTIPKLNTSNVTSLFNTFSGCTNLVEIPPLDTSKVDTMRYMCTNCTYLRNVPVLDTSKLNSSVSFQQTFSGCKNLTEESLDNILQMCINATLYNGTKKLTQLGFSSSINPVSQIQALPHYQAFINAGWTIGY